jgi:hypothetical protein
MGGPTVQADGSGSPGVEATDGDIRRGGADVDRYDRQAARAETLLDRRDDEEFERRPATVDGEQAEVPPPEGVDPDGYGFHLDDPEADLLTEDLDAGLRDDVEADALDALAEAFNARDVEAVLDIVAPDGEAPGVLGYDRDNLPGAIEGLWRRRPTCCLTRGRAELEHVGVLWEHDGAQWWRVAVVHVDDVTDGTVGVLEFSDDPALLERVDVEPPETDDLEEGARWSEWAEGADGDEPESV